MTHFLTGHDLLMCLQRDLSSMLVPPLYRNPVNPPMTL
ncbi:type I restriction enzyme, R subunit [Corynebacterium striatum]|nr:type I restriction enzyme, R subunit [Corynebacterium striatum]STD61236.1 type I restriction enzyme, R subunit [Corynebacterium striatum]